MRPSSPDLVIHHREKQMISLTQLVRKSAAPLVALGIASAAVPASAMTAAPLTDANEAPVVTLVSGGCGIYAHRTAYGYCRPNIVGYRYGYGYRGVGVRLGFGGFRGGYGYHRGYGYHGGYGWRR